MMRLTVHNERRIVKAVLLLATVACGSATAPSNPCAEEMAFERQNYGPPTGGIRNVSPTVQVWTYLPDGPTGDEVVFDWTSGSCVVKSNPL